MLQRGTDHRFTRSGREGGGATGTVTLRENRLVLTQFFALMGVFNSHQENLTSLDFLFLS